MVRKRLPDFLDPGHVRHYRDWVAEVVTRYRNDPTVLAWQLVNEAEAKTAYGGSCSSTAPATLKAFTTDMAALVKSIDPNHLLSLGTIGSGQCGAAGSAYKDLHSVPESTCASTTTTSRGPAWRPVERPCDAPAAVRRAWQAAVRGRAGHPTSLAGTLLGRAALLATKLAGQFAAGVVGILAWDWRDGAHGGSSLVGIRDRPFGSGSGRARRVLRASV